MTIDIDQELALRPLSLREKVAIHLLMVVFRMIIPAKYDHQLRSMMDPVYTLMGLKP